MLNNAFVTRSIIENGIDYSGENPDNFENLYVKWNSEVKIMCHRKIREECTKVRKGLQDIVFKWDQGGGV